MPKVAQLIIERLAGYQSHSGKRAQTHTGATPLSSFGGWWRQDGGVGPFLRGPGPPSFTSCFPLGPGKLCLTQPLDKLSPGLQDPSEDSRPRPLGRHRAICRI